MYVQFTSAHLLICRSAFARLELIPSKITTSLIFIVTSYAEWPDLTSTIKSLLDTVKVLGQPLQ